MIDQDQHAKGDSTLFEKLIRKGFPYKLLNVQYRTHDDGVEFRSMAVVTMFFIDTAPNLIKYIETVRNCLRPGGTADLHLDHPNAYDGELQACEKVEP